MEPLTTVIQLAWGVVSTAAIYYFIKSLRHLYQIKPIAAQKNVLQAWRDYRTWAMGGLCISLLADIALGASIFFPRSLLAALLALAAILALPVLLLYGAMYLYKRVENA